jgi:hypothetical protein
MFYIFNKKDVKENNKHFVFSLTPVSLCLDITSLASNTSLQTSHIVVHENFTVGSFEDNIALVFLPNNTSSTGMTTPYI